MAATDNFDLAQKAKPTPAFQLLCDMGMSFAPESRDKQALMGVEPAVSGFQLAWKTGTTSLMTCGLNCCIGADLITRVRSEAQATHCPAELIERKDISANLAILRFRVSEQPSFTAGQFATIGIAVDGELVERPYSIVSSPHEPFLEFFIELVPGGSITPKLWELELKSTILVRRRIVGQLILDTDVTHHLMLATVTGVAPFVSILRTQKIEREGGATNNRQFVVIHGASQSADLGPYRNELEEMSRAGWLTYIPTVSRPWAEPNWRGETGRVEDIVRKYSDQLGFDHCNSVAYACGHPQMVANVKAILERARFSRNRIKDEKYFSLHAIS